MFENILCVIPARAGSKGIPNKNLIKIAGMPLVAYSIRHALEAGIPSKNIVVSSDSDEILEVAMTYRVMAYKRPAEYAQDTSSTESVLVNVLEYEDPQTKRHFIDDYSAVLLLQPTSPIRLRGRVADCLLAYQSGNYDSLLTSTKFPDMFWRKSNGEGKKIADWLPTYNPKHRKRKQEHTESDFLYFENGSVYITDVHVLWERGCRVGDKVCVFPISEIESIQIDTFEQLNIATKILCMCNFNEISEKDLQDVHIDMPNVV